MIYINYICNGCGLYTSYAGKNERQLNIIEIDVSNYLIFSSGFKPKEPRVKLHFCDSCYGKIMEGQARVSSLGGIEVLRGKLEELEKELDKEKRKFERYKSNVECLLAPIKQESKE